MYNLCCSWKFDITEMYVGLDNTRRDRGRRRVVDEEKEVDGKRLQTDYI